MSYLKKIWGARYFWMHLALSDIRVKYRRSFLGLTWAVIQPLMMTLLLAFVMGRFFHTNMGDYAPFIFSGLVTWDFIVSTAVTGCTAFINAEGYIKQFRHPLMIYTLRSIIPCFINFLYAFVGLLIWVFIWPPKYTGSVASWTTIPLTFLVLFLFAWPISTIHAFIGTKFRDFGQLVIISLQVVYYISPIFFLPKLFTSANLTYFLTYNPIAHLLNLVRAPILHGNFPSLNDYGYVLIMAAFLWLLAFLFVKRNEKTIIFYL